jgi:hypothetical protein
LQFNNHGSELAVDETFFYLLDVGTSNALVLFNETKRIRKEKTLNIVQFKMKLVEDLVGRNIDNLFEGGGAKLTSTPQSTLKMAYGCGVHTVH